MDDDARARIIVTSKIAVFFAEKKGAKKTKKKTRKIRLYLNFVGEFVESWNYYGVENENRANACQSTHNYDEFNSLGDACVRAYEDRSQVKSSHVEWSRVKSNACTKIRRKKYVKS